MNRMFSPIPAMAERTWKAVIVLLSVAVISLTVYCLSQGITIIFMHLYYIPIVLLAYRYRRQGLWGIVFLSFLYLVLVVLFHPADLEIIEGAVIRTLVFIGIGVLVVYLAENLERIRSDLERSQQVQRRIIQNANVWMMVLDEKGRVIEWNPAAELMCGYTFEEVRGRNEVWKALYPDQEYRREILRRINGIISTKSHLENFSTTVTCRGGHTKTILWNTREISHREGEPPLYIGVGVDITEQKRAEEEVTLQAQRTQNLLELNRMKDVPFRDLLGYSLEACLHMTESGYSFIGLISPDESVMTIHSWSKDAMKECTVSDKPMHFPIAAAGVWGEAIRQRTPFILNDYSLAHPAKHGYPEGHVPITRYLGVPIFDGELIVAILAVANKPEDYDEGDINALTTLGNHLWELLHRRQAEEALQFSNIILSTQQEVSLDGILIIDEWGKIISYNQRFADMWNIPPDVLATHSDEQAMQAVLALLVEPEKFLDRVRYLYEHRDQKSREEIALTDGRTFDRYSASITGKDGKYYGRVWYFRDITEQKRAANALIENEKLLTEVGRLARVGGLELDTGTGKIRWTRETYVLHEVYDRDHLELDEALGFFDEPDRIRIREAIQRCTATGEMIDLEVPLTSAKGRRLWVHITGRAVKEGEKTGRLIGAIQDITELKEARDALLQSEEQYRGVAERISDLLLLVDQAGTITYSSPSIGRILGYRPEEVVGTAAFDYVHPESMQSVSEAVDRNLGGVHTEGLEAHVRKNDGSYAVMEMSFAPVIRSGAVDGIQVIGRDVTEKRAAQERIAELLKIHEEEVRVINTSPAVAFLWRAEEGWPVETVSENISQFGYFPEEFLSGRIAFRDIIHPDDLERVNGEVAYNSEHGIDEYIQQYRILGKDGKECWIEDYTHIRRDNEGRITHYEGVILDITRRKRAEDALRRSEQRNARLLEAVPDLMFTISRDGVYLEFHVPDRSVLAIPADQILGRNVRDTGFSEEMTELMMERIARAIDTKELQQFEYDLSLPGGLRHYEARMIALSQEEVLAIVRDVTDQKALQTALRTSEEKYRLLIEKAEEGVWMVDRDYRTTFVNARLAEMFGYRPEEMWGRRVVEFLPESSRETHEKRVRERLQGKSERFEQQFIRKNGSLFWVSASTSPIVEKGEIIGAFSLLTDIDDRKYAEELQKRFTEELEQQVVARTQALNASLQEKVVLLREVHHRVKNNLQIIISLMNLQMRKAEDPRLRDLLLETQDRVRAMSLVHEKLYQSEDLSHINLSTYLHSLGTQLISSHGDIARKITLRMGFDPITTDINIAIPLGLVVNELVSNALKHAFPGEMTGIVTLRGRAENGEIVVSVEDDGIGLPEGFDWRDTPTLGLHLVPALVRQLNGRIEQVGVERGTMFRVVIPGIVTGETS